MANETNTSNNSGTILRGVIAAGFAAIAAFSAGCATEGNPEIVRLDPTLDNVQQHVLTPACATSGCHSEEVAAGGLDLSNADASYAALVGVPADNRVAQQNGWLRVTPGDPEKSFLCRKLENPGLGEGAPMPPGDMMLADDYFFLVEDWIADGAKR